MKISEYSVANAISAANDFILITRTGSTPNTFIVNVSTLLSNTSMLMSLPVSNTPANSTSMVIAKDRVFRDDNFLYVAIANNTLRRIPFQSF